MVQADPERVVTGGETDPRVYPDAPDRTAYREQAVLRDIPVAVVPPVMTVAEDWMGLRATPESLVTTVPVPMELKVCVNSVANTFSAAFL